MIDREYVDTLNSFPALFIGSAVVDFKKNYSGPIARATTPETLRDLVSYYTSMADIGRILVVEDISFFSSQSLEGLLLKFVEESKIPLVLLSTYDKVSPILLSRCKEVVKYYHEKTYSEFLSVSQGSQMVAEVLSPDSHYYDKVRYYSKLSPKLYFLDKNVTSNRVKQKLLQFLD